MKKARARSITSISALARVGCISAAALALASPALAQVPGPDACFALSYDDAHLAAHPGQGVRGLRLWFYDATCGDGDSRSVIVETVMADQGQARADGDIDAETCETPERRSRPRYSLTGDTLRLTLSDLPVGDFCNSMLLSSAADPVGRELRIALTRADEMVCAEPLNTNS